MPPSSGRNGCRYDIRQAIGLSSTSRQIYRNNPACKGSESTHEVSAGERIRGKLWLALIRPSQPCPLSDRYPVRPIGEAKDCCARLSTPGRRRDSASAKRNSSAQRSTSFVI